MKSIDKAIKACDTKWIAYKYKGKFYKAIEGTNPLNASNGIEIDEVEYNNIKHWER